MPPDILLVRFSAMGDILLMTPLLRALREGTALVGDARDKVRQLYPKPDDMTQLLKEDEERFLRSLTKAIGPILKVGANKDKDIAAFPEPITPAERSPPRNSRA